MITPGAKLISSHEAEKLAVELVQNYVNACHCGTVNDIGNVLMKLVSVAGLSMLAVQGQDIAVSRMEATARHLARPELSGNWHMESEH